MSSCIIGLSIFYFIIFIITILTKIIKNKSISKYEIMCSFKIYLGLTVFTIYIFYVIIAIQYIIGVIF